MKVADAGDWVVPVANGPRNDMYIQIMFAGGDVGRQTQQECAALPYEDKVWIAGEYVDWLCGVS